MGYKEQFIKNLKDYRKKFNLTQGDLAEMLGYSQKNIAKWEQGFTLPSIEVVITLANQMGISLDKLFGQDEKSIFEKCENYVFEKFNLDKDKVYSYTTKNIIDIDSQGNEVYESGEMKGEDLVYVSVYRVFLTCFFASKENKDFLKQIESRRSTYVDAVVEFLVENKYFDEVDGKLVASSDLMRECVGCSKKIGCK